MTHFKTMIDAICTKADYKTITSKAGVKYETVQCEFRNMNTELTNVTIFADKEGWLPKLSVGETYKLQFARYYSMKVNKEVEIIKVVQNKE